MNKKKVGDVGRRGVGTACLTNPDHAPVGHRTGTCAFAFLGGRRKRGWRVERVSIGAGASQARAAPCRRPRWSLCLREHEAYILTGAEVGAASCGLASSLGVAWRPWRIHRCRSCRRYTAAVVPPSLPPPPSSVQGAPQAVRTTVLAPTWHKASATQKKQNAGQDKVGLRLKHCPCLAPQKARA